MTSAFSFPLKSVCKKISIFRSFSSAYCKLAANKSVDSEEVKKFDSTAQEWWHGKSYDLLHRYNNLRVPLIRDGILSVQKSYKQVSNPLDGLHILDVGCGGGILAEPLARLGAKVTGLDPGPHNIEIATEHASKDLEIKERLTYVCDTIENLSTSGTKFDAVICSEVVEHVNSVQTFVQSCVDLTKNDGSLFFTTINKTNISFVLSIVMAEYVLGLVPRGTHEWNKFVNPKDLVKILESLNCTTVSLEGVIYNPVTKKFSWSKSTDNLYALHAVKQ